MRIAHNKIAQEGGYTRLACRRHAVGNQLRLQLQQIYWVVALYSDSFFRFRFLRARGNCFCSLSCSVLSPTDSAVRFLLIRRHSSPPSLLKIGHWHKQASLGIMIFHVKLDLLSLSSFNLLPTIHLFLQILSNTCSLRTSKS